MDDSRQPTHAKNWDEKARENAADCVYALSSELTSYYLDNGEFPPYGDVSELPNSAEETWQSQLPYDFDLIKSACILNDLREHEETDQGLWSDSDDPITAVRVKAWRTYENAVRHYWTELLSELGDISALTALYEGYQEEDAKDDPVYSLGDVSKCVEWVIVHRDEALPEYDTDTPLAVQMDWFRERGGLPL